MSPAADSAPEEKDQAWVPRHLMSQEVPEILLHIQLDLCRGQNLGLYELDVPSAKPAELEGLKVFVLDSWVPLSLSTRSFVLVTPVNKAATATIGGKPAVFRRLVLKSADCQQIQHLPQGRQTQHTQ